jgi:TRAP-type uncharacterized transport system substrate-binding protein
VEEGKVARVNDWTVGIAGGLLEGTFIRFAAELAKALDDGDNLRVLPIVTYGAAENVSDLLYLLGVDIAITYSDVLDQYRKSGEVQNIEQRINYISQLYIGELHAFACPEIRTLADLDGKKVGFNTKGAGPTITGPIVFERLGVHVEPVFINNAIAIEKMRTGELAAILHTVGKPNDLFVKLQPIPGFHRCFPRRKPRRSGRGGGAGPLLAKEKLIISSSLFDISVASCREEVLT